MLDQDHPARYDVRTQDVEYLRVGKLALLATIYVPVGVDGAPAMVDVHGGAWTTGDRSGDRNVSHGLAERGVVVMSPDFRVAPEHPYPAQVQDVHAAVRWLKSHAVDLGADPTRVGAFGSSSGGHTAMLVAMRPNDPRYAVHAGDGLADDAQLSYVIGGWSIMDPYSRYFFAIETGRQDLITRTQGYFPDQDCMREGNPQMILDRGEPAELPRLLLIQGSADTNIPMALTLKFAASYIARGGNARLEQFPGMPHNFCTELRPETTRAIELMRQFID
ncbi:MAG: alpha/beta hydrolase [Chloroflexota bacterium]